MIDGVEEYVLETADDDDEESFMTSLCPTDMFLTEKSVRSEIKLKDLSSEERKKFEASMAKEWSSWEKFNAVEVLNPLRRHCRHEGSSLRAGRGAIGKDEDLALRRSLGLWAWL